jgi:hypothetical protein
VDALFSRIEGDLLKDDELAELALELGMVGRKVEARAEALREEESEDLVESIIQGVVNNFITEVRLEHGADGQTLKGNWYAVSRGDGTAWFECRDHDPFAHVETKAGIGGHNRMMHGDPDEIAATQAKAHAATAKQAADRKARVTEVTRIPWLAKKGSGQGEGVGRVYSHEFVDEVTYADGTVEYECNICHEFTREKGRPVAQHVGSAHKDRKRTQAVETHVTTEYPPPEYRYPSGHHAHRRSPKLRTEVLSALDTIENWHLLSREELATQIEERIMEGRPERQPTEPLTDAEVLARIAMLLDRGQFDQMRQEVNVLTQQVVALTGERDEAVVSAEVATAAAERARTNLRTFKELVSEVEE